MVDLAQLYIHQHYTVTTSPGRTIQYLLKARHVSFIDKKSSSATTAWPPFYLLRLSGVLLRARSERSLLCLPLLDRTHLHSQFTHLPLVLLSAKPWIPRSSPDCLCSSCVHHFPTFFLVLVSMVYDFAFFLWFLDSCLLPARICKFVSDWLPMCDCLAFQQRLRLLNF